MNFAVLIVVLAIVMLTALVLAATGWRRATGGGGAACQKCSGARDAVRVTLRSGLDPALQIHDLWMMAGMANLCGSTVRPLDLVAFCERCGTRWIVERPAEAVSTLP